MRAFFIMWIGQFISMIGSELSFFGLGVWIFEQTGKATPFALIALTGNLPRLLLSPIAGVVADRYNRRLIMIITDTMSAITTLAAVFLLATNSLQIWHVYVIALISSIGGAFQEPAHQASITMLVPKKQLGRASGMMEMAGAVSRLIAPLFAGILYVTVKLHGIFLFDFVTFFFAIGALMLIRIPQPKMEQTEAAQGGFKATLSQAAYGWKYIVARGGLISMLIYFALVNFLLNLAAVLSSPLILSFASAGEYGAIQSVIGLGMLVGSIVMSAWGGPKRKMYGVYGFIALMGVGLAIIGFRPSIFVIGAGYFVFMFALPFASGSSRAIWQSKVAPEVQGRVFATRSMISTCMMPIAFLLAGPLADQIATPLMSEGGALASTFIGQLIGVGVGRGVGLIFVTSGIVLLVVTAAFFAYAPLRRVEFELPDALPDAPAASPTEADTPAIDAGAQPAAA